MLVKINDYEFDASVSEDEGDITINFVVIGNDYRVLYNSLFSFNDVNLFIPNLNVDYRAKIVNSSNSYTGELNKSTKVSFNVTLRELNKKNEDDIGVLGRFGHTAFMNWSRTRALAEVLIDNGVMTWDEYDEKVDEVVNRDYNSMIERMTAYNPPK